MEYDIVTDYASDKLKAKVNAKLAEGWKLQGFLRVERCGAGMLWMHCMTKEKSSSVNSIDLLNDRS